MSNRQTVWRRVDAKRESSLVAVERGWHHGVLEEELSACELAPARRGAHMLQLRGLLDFDEPEPAEDFDDDEDPDDDDDGDVVDRRTPAASAHVLEDGVPDAVILRRLAGDRRTVTNPGYVRAPGDARHSRHRHTSIQSHGRP